MRILGTILAVIMSLALVPGAAVAGGKKPFTATAVQSDKGQPAQSGTIFVSDNGTRFEYVERGRQMVKIILPKQKIMRILFPQEKLYMEIQAPADTPVAGGDNVKPCPEIDGLTCKKIGDAKFGTFDVQQWQQHYAPTNSTSMLWWEPVRNMIVRQEFPDGRILQLTYTGIVTFEGREAEHWDISLAATDGKIATAYRLVDMDLGIIVKEENAATGISRELRGLKVADSDSAWFDVPADYQRIEAPNEQHPPRQ